MLHRIETAPALALSPDLDSMRSRRILLLLGVLLLALQVVVGQEAKLQIGVKVIVC